MPLGKRFLVFKRHDDTFQCHEPLTCGHSITVWEIWMLSNPTVRTLNLAAWCLAYEGNIAFILTITYVNQF